MIKRCTKGKKTRSWTQIAVLFVLQFFFLSSVLPAYALRTPSLSARDGGVHGVLKDLQQNPSPLSLTAKDGAQRLGPYTQKVVDRINEVLSSFPADRPLTQANQEHLANWLETVYQETLIPHASEILKEVGIDERVAEKRKEKDLSPTDYPRVVIHLDEDGRYEFTIIAYLPGQRNPVHNHGGNVCAFCIAGGGIGKERRYEAEETLEATEREGTVHLRQIGEETIRAGSISKITQTMNPIHQIINDGDQPLYEFAIYSKPLVVTGINVFRPTEEAGHFQVVHHTPGNHSFEGTAHDGGEKVARPVEESILEIVPGVEFRGIRVESPKAKVLFIEPPDGKIFEKYKARRDVDVDFLRTGSEIFPAGEGYYQRLGQEAFLEIVRRGDYDYITGFTNLSFDKEVFEASPHLKGILQFSIGYNNVDLQAARERGIFVTNAQTPQGSPLTIAMAELNIGFMLEAKYRLTDSISREKIGEKKLEEIFLTAPPQKQQATAEILWGELLRRSLRLDDMFQFVKDGKYCGCGVGPEATVLHDQLGADPEVGVKTPLGIVGMGEAGKRLVELANAHGIASLYYSTPEDQRLSADEEARLHLTYLPLSDLYKIHREGGYIIRLPGAPLLSKPEHPETHYRLVDPEELWVKSGREQSLLKETLSGKTLGIGGYGRIGQAVARRAAVFGMNVLAFEKSPHNIQLAQQQGAEVVDKDTFFERSDVITTLFDLNPDTRQWVSKEYLEKIKNPEVILINTSRGPVVDEEALTTYGRNHPDVQIRVDVLTDESNRNGNTKYGLAELPNARVTGHTGSAVIPVRRRMQEIAFENLSAILDGAFPKNPVPGVPVGEVLARRMYYEALKSLQADEAVKRNVSYDADSERLTIQGRIYDLRGIQNIYVIGYGKVVGEMATALTKILGERITRGVINVPEAQRNAHHGRIGRIQLYAGDHPIPNEGGMQGTKRMIDLVSKARSKDMVIALISGGGSAIGALPVDEVPIEDLQEVYERLENESVNIHDKNIVRSHLDGRFALLKLAERARHFVSLLISDVPGDDPQDIASGYTVANTSAFEDARSVLRKKTKLWKKIPTSIQAYIEKHIGKDHYGVPRPSDPLFEGGRVQAAILVSNQRALERMAEVAASFGLKTKVVTDPLRESVKEEADRIVKDITDGSLEEKPHVILYGGETTIQIPSHAKQGGRNSHLALEVARDLSLLDDINPSEVSFMAVTTDGKDGNWDGAGTIVTGKTVGLSQEREDVAFGTAMDEYDTGNFARMMGIDITTGPTGTNVADLAVAVILPRKTLSARDGGTKVSLAIDEVIAQVKASPRPDGEGEIGEAGFQTIMDLVTPEVLAERIRDLTAEPAITGLQIDAAGVPEVLDHVTSGLLSLMTPGDLTTLTLARELLIQEGRRRGSPLMTFSQDLHHPTIKGVVGDLNSMTPHQDGFGIAVLSVARLLDDRLDAEGLSNLLKETEGHLFFTEPSQAVAEELTIRYGALMGEIQKRFMQNNAGEAILKTFIVYLLDEEDQARYHVQDFFSLTRIGQGRREIAVPLRSPVDLARETALALQLVWRLSVPILGEDTALGTRIHPLEKIKVKGLGSVLDTNTTLLLAEVTSGFQEAGKWITAADVQEEVAEAKKTLTEVLTGL